MNGVNFLGTGADDQALALKLYMGKFNEAWRNPAHIADTGLPVIHRKTVTDGKSWQFLQLADSPEAENFTPGDEMLGQDFAIHEGTITPDMYLVAHKFVKKDQFHLAHFDILSRFARQHARKIAQRRDKRLFTMAALAARAAAVTKNGLAVHNGGNRVTRAVASGVKATAYPLSATGAANIRADLRTLGYQMDLDMIPQDNRYAWADPWIRQVLLYDNTSQLFSEDYIDGENKIQKRQIMLVEGFKIVGWPNTTSVGGPLPNENITSELAKYNADFSGAGTTDGTPVVIVLTEGPDGGAAIGEVTFERVSHVVKYIEERLGWLMMSYTLQGCGRIDDYCAGSIEVISS